MGCVPSPVELVEKQRYRPDPTTHNPLLTKAHDRSPDKVLRRFLQVVRPANLGEKVQPECGHVDGVLAQLGRLVVPGKHVVIVVPTFAHGHHRYQLVLDGLNVPRKDKVSIKLQPSKNQKKLHSLVVRPVAEDVGGAVD